MCLVLHLPKTHPDQSNLEYAYFLAGKVRQVSDANQGIRDSGTKIVHPYLGRKLSMSADNVIFPGATKGQLQFQSVPDADLTLLFAPRKSVRFRKIPLRVVLITQRSVVQIHPPQPT
jgi:hypothetical protein